MGLELSPIILHTDLDCFYCQVERIRLDLPEDQPMAVQQWAGVIAVNYAARAQGVTRHSNISECLEKCPSMVFVHVPTFSIKDPGKVFRYDAKGATKEEPVPRSADRAEHKASLSPYRKASLAIFRVFERFADVLEKAGLDEAFMDVSKTVNKMFREAFDVDIEEEENWEGLEEVWASLDWTELGVAAINAETPIDVITSSSIMVEDIRIWLGAKLARQIRMALREELGYTCSIGIAPNKMLAKLGSARNKPFNQTYVLHRMINTYMQQVPLKKIRFLGGKLGAKLLGAASDTAEKDPDDEGLGFSSDDEEEDGPAAKAGEPVMASDLWTLNKVELSFRLGGDLESAAWAYNIIRGIDPSPVTPRSKPKSFMAAKSMKPALKEWAQVELWLRLLCTEIWERLEEDYQANKRWPRTVTLYFKGKNMSDGKGHSTEFPVFSPDLFSVELLVAFLIKILHQEPQSILPMIYLTVSVSRFVPLEVNSDGKKWSTLDKFMSAGKRPPDFGSIKPAPTAAKSTAADAAAAPALKKPKFTEFFKPKVKEAPSDVWQCEECPASLSMFLIDEIQEHQDYHMACKLSKLT